MIRLPNDEEEWERAAAALALASSRPGSAPTAASSSANEVASAASAFGSMRIMSPPPAADNGGAFERSSDGNGGEAVSPATANAASAQHGPLDPVLVSCLENPRERLSMLKFEDQIVRFVKNPRESQLSFPPLSSYHRLIIHRLAQRCFLEHQTGEYNPYAQQQGFDGNASRVVTLFKTPQSAVPAVLLIDLSSDRQQPAVTPASAPRIMMRKRGAQRPGANGGRGSAGGKDGSKGTRSMQDRERAYAEARARIFGEDSAADTASSTSSTASSSVATKASESGGATGNSSANGQSRHGNRQAAGPDGSKGFNRTRGTSPSPNAQDDTANSGQTSQKQQQRPARSPVTDPQGWKESKVLWRNREQELNDPDFTRNHGAYRPIRTANGGNDGFYHRSQQQQQQPQRYGAGAPSYGRYGGEYDRSQPGGYSPQHQQQQQQMPPPPFAVAGGRGRYSGEYNNRVDGMVSPPPQQQQQQQFYRGGHHQMTPPPPVAVMGRGYNAYAAQTRSPSRFPAAMTTGFESGGGNGRNGNGGYNDDFPPLGR